MSGGRGAPGRVAAIHAQTRRGLAVAAAFVASAAVVGLASPGSGWWLPLHLFVVGGLLSAISSTTQMFAVTWSAAPAPRAVVAGAQRWLLSASAVLLVVGRETDRTWMFVGGGIGVVVAMLALTAILLMIRHEVVTDRFAPAIEAYVAAVLLGAAGMSLGILLGTGRTGTRFAELRDTHLVLNVFGLVGLVIAGSLPYFAATQVRSKMSPRATPLAIRATIGWLAAAIVTAATGGLFDRPDVVAAGLLGYASGLLVIGALLPMYRRSRLTWAGPRAVQLLTGLGWWTAMTIALAIAVARDSNELVFLQVLVIGGFAQILIGSLAYLGPVLRSGGHRRLTAGFAITRSWVSLGAGNLAALAALVGHGPTLVAALAIWLADVVVRSVRLLTIGESHDVAQGSPSA